MEEVQIFAISGGACVGCGSNGERRFARPEDVAQAMAEAARRPERQAKPRRVKPRRKAA